LASIKDIDDLFGRMRVPDQRRFRADVDARPDHLAPGNAEILPLQIDAPQSRRLLDCPTRVAAVVVGRAHRRLPRKVVDQMTVTPLPFRGITLVVPHR
jgi:hypothetical protein